MKAVLGIAAFAVLTLCSTGGAKVVASPKAAAVANPEKGAGMAEQGPYRAIFEPASGAPGLRVFRPESLDRFPRRDILPVVVWGNGGCTYDTPVYTNFLLTVASHGFLVVTTAATPGKAAPSREVTVDDLEAAIDWAKREKPLASRDGDALQRLHGPVLLIAGGETDFMQVPSKATYDAIDKVPVFYGSLHGAGHVGTVTQPGGGEFANAAASWALWQLKGDRKASRMFVGTKCGLCTKPNWDTQSKRLVCATVRYGSSSR